MGLHCNKEIMRLALSAAGDAKPRLKWTRDLHQRFVDAVNQLGGSHKATPKCLMRVMGITGLTLYHLKSHLQKYRLGKGQQAQLTNKFGVGAEEEINEDSHVAEALQMQIEVQKKLHEQIQVQKHLQLRIEAQGKYLSSVLKRAQDTLSEYGSCLIKVERVKAKLCHLASMVDSGCPTSQLSSLTDESKEETGDGTSELKRRKRCDESKGFDLNCKAMNEADSLAEGIDLNRNGHVVVDMVGANFTV